MGLRCVMPHGDPRPPPGSDAEAEPRPRDAAAALALCARFNVRYERTGHLFERRYGSNRIWTPERFAAAVEYIDQNPVAAGLSATPADWPWSSAGTRAAGDPPPWLAELERVQEIWRQLVS